MRCTNNGRFRDKLRRGVMGEIGGWRIPRGGRGPRAVEKNSRHWVTVLRACAVRAPWGRIPPHKPHLHGPKRPLGTATPSTGDKEGPGWFRWGGCKSISAPTAPQACFLRALALLVHIGYLIYNGTSDAIWASEVASIHMKYIP